MGEFLRAFFGQFLFFASASGFPIQFLFILAGGIGWDKDSPWNFAGTLDPYTFGLSLYTPIIGTKGSTLSGGPRCHVGLGFRT